MTQQQPYSPHDHLIKIRAKDGTMKDYYPANWRFYELRQLYPNITIESEIVHLDVEQALVIVKAWIYDGKTYAESERRASSFKQGPVSQLDKVETAAKARAARDFGIGTEYAMDSESSLEEEVDTPAERPPQGKGKPVQKGNLTVVPQANGTGVSPLLATLQEMYTYARDLGLVTDLASWEKLKTTILGNAVHDEDMTGAHVELMRKGLAERKKLVNKK